MSSLLRPAPVNFGKVIKHLEGAEKAQLRSEVYSRLFLLVWREWLFSRLENHLVWPVRVTCGGA